MIPDMFISATLRYGNGFVNGAIVAGQDVLCLTFEEVVQAVIDVDTGAILPAPRTNKPRTLPAIKVVDALPTFLVDETCHQETITW
jgi:hypothetical protein